MRRLSALTGLGLAYWSWEPLRSRRLSYGRASSRRMTSGLIAQYRQLREIEHCIRINKHDLPPHRPLDPAPCPRHIALCDMAFCCLAHLLHRLTLLGHIS